MIGIGYPNGNTSEICDKGNPLPFASPRHSAGVLGIKADSNPKGVI